MSRSAIQTVVVAGVAMVVIGYVLRSDSRCDRGCQTFAEHLIAHGWRKLIGLL